MKIKFLACAMLLGVHWLSAQSTQVVDLSTGVINGTTTLAPVCNVDDTWAVSVMGSPYFNLLVSNNTFDYVNVYNVHVPSPAVSTTCARWISPVVNTASGPYYGMINNASVGSYSYKMTFNSFNCTPTGAMLNLNYVAADNSLDMITINGVTHNLTSYSIDFSSLKTINLPISASEIVAGTNTVIITVMNGSSFTGMFLCGNLTINYASDPNLIPSITGNSSFCAGTPVTLTGSDGPSTAVNHVWTVVESNSTGAPVSGATEWWSPWATGSPGVYTLPTTGGPNLVCGKYYRVKLAVQNDCNNWVEFSKVIFITCGPTVTLSAATSICEESSTVLTASASGGPSPYTYNWYQTTPTLTTLLLNGTNTLTVSPTVTTTYAVNVIAANGCSTWKYVTVNVVPYGYLSVLSTGYDNVSNSLITPGNPDDEWATISAPLGNVGVSATCINHTISGNPWAYNPTTTGRWITSDAYGSDAHNHMYAGSGHYIYERTFIVPLNYVCTLTLTKFAADNDGTIYLDGTPLVSLNPSAPSTNYTVGTTSPVSVSLSAGTHVLRGDITEYDRYTGMFLEAYVSGTCRIGRRGYESTVTTLENTPEVNMSIYPNPGTGVFTLELDKETDASIEIYDIMGKNVSSFKQSTFTSVFDLSTFPKGMYIVNVIANGTKTSKKIILE